MSFWDGFRPQHLEEDETLLSQLAEQETISLKELAQGIYELFYRCKVDQDDYPLGFPGSFLFKIGHTEIAMMFHNNAIVSVNFGGEKSLSESESSSDEEEEDKDEQEEKKSVTPKEEESGWTEVKSRTKGRKVLATLPTLRVSVPGHMETSVFLYFEDNANSTQWDFVDVVVGVSELKKRLQMNQHGYCMDDNWVVNCEDNGYGEAVIRGFIPNEAYMKRMTEWMNALNLGTERDTNTIKTRALVYQDQDQRIFQLFTNASTWSWWSLLPGTFQGLRSVRRYIKTHVTAGDWFHAYCEETQDLYNFKREFNRICHRFGTAPVPYVKRYQQFLVNHQTADNTTANKEEKE